ncbi:MAG: Alpha,alpha-trehalase [Polaromonas sp.]|nr:Alpha,alpha-trehalase [Polaromonas sp.]
MKLALDGRPERRQAGAADCPPADAQSPADRYQELFVAVQRGRVFADSKTFVDCAPQRPPEDILSDYREECSRAGFDLKAFVRWCFKPPAVAASAYVSTPGQPLAAHIDSLWPLLTRHPSTHPNRGSLLPLPHAYLVPGGRFAELYYWDSYFTMLGLAPCGHADLVHAMTDNFACLIDTFGHVPNGNRTYYLSRSQPPVFSLMVELCERCGGQPALGYLPQLRREHAWWMDGEHGLRAGEAFRRVVALPGGSVLNRYWDDRDTPREESWREDVATAAQSDRPAAEVYRDLRAAAESGWDFSTRWLRHADPADPRSLSLASICTTAIVPVDLNAFLFRLETTIARLSRMAGDAAAAQAFTQRAATRREAVDRLMWSEEEGAYFDHDWQRRQRRTNLTAAAVTPLFTGMASRHQAGRLAATFGRRMLAPGGVSTTELASHEQWDRPNGWAPLQWMAATGFADYGLHALAQDIRSRWLGTVQAVYAREGKLVEKYALRETPDQHACGGDGGEYPLQDGFGWTNGVTRCWLDGNGGV